MGLSENESYNQYFTVRSKCPACNHTESKVIYERSFLQEPIVKFLERKLRPEVIKNYDGASYVLRKCNHCALIYQEQILTDEGLNLLYDKWLFEGDTEEIKISEIEKFLFYTQELLRVRRFFKKPVTEIKILDYGMGQGKWCSVAHAIGFNVTGTDLSNQLIEKSKEKGFAVVPLNELNQHKFDFVNTEQVFEHLSQPLDTLIRLKEMLSENGIIKISVPNGNHVEKKIPNMDWTAPRGHKNLLIPITPSIHINAYSYDSIIKMGEAAGLKPVNASILSEYTILSALSIKDLIKSLLRPIYWRYIKHTYVFLQKK